MAFFCCFREGVAGMSQNSGRDVPDFENVVQENFGLIFGSLKHCPAYFAQKVGEKMPKEGRVDGEGLVI